MTVANKVVNLLIKKHISIATMESCTSGLVASMITDTEGASAIFYGGFITYSNQTKIAVGIDENIIRNYGVYSNECAENMAIVSQQKFQTNIGIGVTGTTGNVDSNNPNSSIGEVFYCITYDDKKYRFHRKLDVKNISRNEIKQAYANLIFNDLIQILL